MSLRDVETAITKLSAKELTGFAEWFAEHHTQVWDEQIERGLDAERLDAVLARVNAEYEAGKAKPL